MEEEREIFKREMQEDLDANRAKLFLPLGAQVSDVDTREGEEDGPQLVDKIESLCMNCGDNVRSFELSNYRLCLTCSRAKHASCPPRFPFSAKSS